MHDLPARYDVIIEPSGPLGGYVAVPPSKNYTTRCILAAAMAKGKSVIHRPAANEDAQALVRCCRALGAKIEEQGEALAIEGVAARPRNPWSLSVGNAGAVLRLLLGIACLVEKEIRFETSHPESLGKRPNEDLLKALRQFGAEAQGEGPEGLLPISIHGGRGPVWGAKVSVSGAKSSQYLSSLLFLATMADGKSEINVTGANPGDPPVLVSRPLIDQTLEVLRNFGAKIDAAADGFHYSIPGGQVLRAREARVNGDWPSAAALMAAVAVAGGMAGLDGLQEDAQGERRAKDALEAMGCAFTRGDGGQLFVHSKAGLRGIEFNGDLATDAVLALEAAACLADGTSRFNNIGNLKLKETDRIRVPLEELKKIGVSARHGEDWVEIDGAPDGYEGGIEVDCRGDHRIAQALAIVGMRCAKGLTLKGAECAAKSYPDFFEDLKKLGVKLKVQARQNGA